MRIAIVLGFCFISFWAKAQNEDVYIQDFLHKWENSEKYLIDVIDAMPADLMEFKPIESSNSFREVVTHIVSNMVWLSTDYLGANGFESGYKERDLNKEELKDLVTKAFQYSRKAIQEFPTNELYKEHDFFAGPMNTIQIMRLLNDHLSHHRGQLTVSLRLNDIAIPRYIGW